MPSQLCLQAKPYFPTFGEAQTKTKNVPKKPEITREEVIGNVAEILDEMIVQRGCNYTDVNEIPEVTPFHAKKLPPISLKTYLLRFADFTECHESIFIYALIFLDRCSENIEDFALDSFNVMRLMVVSLVVAIKFFDDKYCKNSYYSRVGGLQVEEFNKLEVKFLHKYINYELFVDNETYDSYYEDVVKMGSSKK